MVRRGRPVSKGGKKEEKIIIRVTEWQREVYDRRMEAHDDAAQLLRDHIETWADGEHEDGPIGYNADALFNDYEKFECYNRSDRGEAFLTDRGMTLEQAQEFIDDYGRDHRGVD